MAGETTLEPMSLAAICADFYINQKLALKMDVPTGRESVLTANTEISEEERKAKAVFEALGDGLGTRAQVALRYVLSNPHVSCAVIGSAELDHIDEALQAAEMGPLPPEALARLDTLYATDFGRV